MRQGFFDVAGFRYRRWRLALAAAAQVGATDVRWLTPMLPAKSLAVQPAAGRITDQLSVGDSRRRAGACGGGGGGVPLRRPPCRDAGQNRCR